MAETNKTHERSAATASKAAALDPTLDSAKIDEMKRKQEQAQRESEITGPESFTYHPGAGDPQSISFAGQVFKAGESVSVEDPKHILKLRSNPVFMEPEKRAKALEQYKRETDPDFQAREQRALQAEADLGAARGDPDRDEIDMRIPEVPQAQSLTQVQQKQRMEALLKAPHTRPPPEGGEGEGGEGEAARGSKAKAKA